MATARKRIKIGNDTADIHDARLPDSLGTAGQVLKMNSGATGIEWGSAGGGITELVGTTLRITDITKTGVYLLRYSNSSVAGSSISVYYDGQTSSKIIYIPDGSFLRITVYSNSRTWGIWLNASAFVFGTTYTSSGYWKSQGLDSVISYSYGTGNLYKHTYTYAVNSSKKVRFSVICPSENYWPVTNVLYLLERNINSLSDVSYYADGYWHPSTIHSFSSGTASLAISYSSTSTFEIAQSNMTTSNTTVVSIDLSYLTKEWYDY